MPNESLTIVVRGDSASAVQALERVARTLEKTVNATEKAGTQGSANAKKLAQALQQTRAAAEGLHSVTSRLAAPLAAVAGGLGLVAKTGVDFNETVKRSEQALTLLSGSAGKAKQFIAALREEARVTDPTFKQLLPIAQSLAGAYGPGGLGRVLPTLRAFGDAAKVLGADTEAMSRALLGFRQVLSRDFATQEDLNQVGENLPGFNLRQVLRDQLGSADTETLAKAGVTGRQVADALLRGMEQQFGGAQRRMAGSLSTSLSGLTDTLQEFAGELTTQLSPAIQGGVKDVSAALQEFRKDPAAMKALKEVFVGIGNAIRDVGKSIAGALRWWRDLTPEQRKSHAEAATGALKFAALALVLGNVAKAAGGLFAALDKLRPLLLFLGKDKLFTFLIGAGVVGVAEQTLDPVKALNKMRMAGQGLVPPELRSEFAPGTDALRRQLSRSPNDAEMAKLTAEIGRKLGRPHSWRIPGLPDVKFMEQPGAGAKRPSTAEELEARKRVGALDAEKQAKASADAAQKLVDARMFAARAQVDAMPVDSAEQRRRQRVRMAMLEAEQQQLAARDQIKGNPQLLGVTLTAIDQRLKNSVAEARRDADLEALRARGMRSEKTLGNFLDAVDQAAAGVRRRVSGTDAARDLAAGQTRLGLLRSFSSEKNPLMQGLLTPEKARLIEELQRARERVGAAEAAVAREVVELRRQELALAMDTARTDGERLAVLERQRNLVLQSLVEEEDPGRAIGLQRELVALDQERLRIEQARTDAATDGLEKELQREALLRQEEAALAKMRRDLEALDAHAAGGATLRGFLSGRLGALDGQAALFGAAGGDTESPETAEAVLERKRKLLEIERERREVLRQIQELNDEELETLEQVAAAAREAGRELLTRLAEGRRRLAEAQAESGVRSAQRGGDPSQMRAALEAQLAMVREQISRAQSRLGGASGEGALKLQLDLVGLRDQEGELLSRMEQLRGRWQRFWRELGRDVEQSVRGAVTSALESAFSGRGNWTKQLAQSLRSVVSRALAQMVVGQVSGLLRRAFGGLRGRRGADAGGNAGDPDDPDFVGPPAPGRTVSTSNPRQHLAQTVAGVAGALGGLIQVFGQGKSKLASTIAGVLQVIGSLAQLGGAAGGFGGILGAVGSLFGGLFADGGRPPLGRVSLVGERGPEFFVPDVAGTILPMSRAGSLAGMGGGTRNVNVNISQTVHQVDRGVDLQRVNRDMVDYTWKYLRTA